MRYFGRGLFTFLKDLTDNNNREWFQANKERYVAEVEEPFLRFVGDLGGKLRKVAPRIVADPRKQGGSMFRIYRDTRFSKDKSPYKTWIAAHFRHEAGADDKERSVPGYYVSLQLGTSHAGGGIYHPLPDDLTKIRERIVAKPKEWAAVRDGVELRGEALKRPPAGYAADHPFVEDLRRKDHYAMTELKEREVIAADFDEKFVAACARVAPLMKFACAAMGLRW
jgi:uncharacterized protein (TIGR02453 family)